jgi:peptide/nickel transport system substrate-binding protein
MRSKQWAYSALAVAVASTLLVGCSAQATPAANAKHDFVVGLASEPPHFNLGLTTSGDAEMVGSAVYESLVKLGKDFTILPGLAESWSANADSTEFTFKLRQGVKWQDGKPFTSADVKFHFDKIEPLYPLGASIAALYSETATPDEHTAIVKLKAPFGPFFEAVTANYLLPAHLYEGTDIATNPTNLHPVGTGPFKFESFTAGDSAVLTKNEDYWGKQGDVDRLIFQIMPDANARALALQSGALDFTLNIPLAQLSSVKSNSAFQLSDWTLPEHLYAFFNTTNPVLQNADVRKALYRAIDREEIAEKVYLGTATSSRSPIPNQISWAIDQSTDYTKEFGFDLEAAGVALDKAGYPKGADGSRFGLNVTYRTDNPTWARTAELIKTSYEKIGVKVNLVGQETKVYADSIFKQHAFDMVLTQMGAYADPSLGVARAYICNPDNLAFRNPTGICDAAIDAAFAAAAATTDREKRVEQFKSAADAVANTVATAPLESISMIQVVRSDRWDGLGQFTSVHNHDWSALIAKG